MAHAVEQKHNPSLIAQLASEASRMFQLAGSHLLWLIWIRSSSLINEHQYIVGLYYLDRAFAFFDGREAFRQMEEVFRVQTRVLYGLRMLCFLCALTPRKIYISILTSAAIKIIVLISLLPATGVQLRESEKACRRPVGNGYRLHSRVWQTCAIFKLQSMLIHFLTENIHFSLSHTWRDSSGFDLKLFSTSLFI